MDIEILKLKLNDYESNKISREELIDWAYQMLNRMIKSKEVLTLKGIVMSNIINYIDSLPENMQNELEVSSLYIQDEIKSSTEY